MMACSISAPLKPSEASAISATSNLAGSRLRFFRWMPTIWVRASRLGRSMKKISSKRPLRSSSGGRASMSLAVAMRKTGAVCSCIQVRREPNIRLERPPSVLRLAADAKPFSISSIQRITGDMRSAWLRASRRRRSDSPM